MLSTPWSAHSVIMLLSLISCVSSSNTTAPCRDLLHRLGIINRIGIHSLRFRDKKPRHDSPQQVSREEDPEDLGDANARGEPVEEDSGEDGAKLADGGGEPMGKSSNSRGVD